MSGAPTIVGSRRVLEPTQKSSHAAMTHDVSWARAPRRTDRAGRFDAIFVPASRGAGALDAAARLSARLEAPLVALCSLDARAAEVATRLTRISGCRALVVNVPRGYRHALLPRRTAAPRFQVAAANRRSDLSLKRNLGLLLARLHGWGKILFLDDDITDRVHGFPISLPTVTARRLAAELDSRQIAGLTCRDFPDNSVVCHARRLAGFRQDTFVSGSALGVNCNDQPIPFFPSQYNEDWFFFSSLAAERNLGFAGSAIQAPYDPYADPNRAREEEFGDLLAEGLYTLFEQQRAEMKYSRRLDEADETYWEKFIEARRNMIGLTALSLEVAVEYAHDVDRCAAALRSLDAAQQQLSRLSPGICADFVDAWASDLLDWQHATQRLSSAGRTENALAALGLNDWYLVGEQGRTRRHPRVRPAAPSGVPARACHRPTASSSPARVPAPRRNPG